MSDLLTTGCVLTCTMGDIPSVFIALDLPGKPVVDGGFAAATIAEIIPEANIPSFGMCNSPTNPEVIAATAAALGVFTPMPCIPIVPDPWDPPSAVAHYTELPLATVTSKCMCIWEGEISVDTPGQAIVSAS